MTVRYLTNDEKQKYYGKFPFLKDIIENNAIEAIYVTKCKELPKKDFSYEHLTYDHHYMNTVDFEDENNLYRVIDDHLVIDLDNDDPPIASDHKIDVYVKPKHQSKLVIVSGPSGVGKGPIIEWMKKLYCPNLVQAKVRKEQTHGNEKTGNIDDIGNKLEIDCRGTRQAIDLNELDKSLKENKVVLLETYHTALDEIVKKYEDNVWVEPVFISPLDDSEITELGDNIKTYLPELMYNSLIKRTIDEKTELTDKVLDNLRKRADDSMNEINIRKKYKHIIPNHCFESDPRWKLPILIGEPKKVVDKLYEIINS